MINFQELLIVGLLFMNGLILKAIFINLIKVNFCLKTIGKWPIWINGDIFSIQVNVLMVLYKKVNIVIFRSLCMELVESEDNGHILISFPHLQPKKIKYC